MVKLEHPAIAEHEIEARRTQACQQDDSGKVYIKAIEENGEKEKDNEAYDDP